ncbi:MAG: hypothetical protein J6K39_03970 [Clostridia bacterium]|nr:hypothetical protein [Clostridia bacterium]
MNTNLEIYNFLNLINPRLGRLYKKTVRSFLPDNFSPTQEQIKQIFILKKLENKKASPQFIFNDKKIIKKHFKNSLKNCKKIAKNLKNSEKNNKIDIFDLNFYINLRIALTEDLIKNFKNHDFDEMEAYQEIFNLNPVFGELLKELFEEAVDLELLLENIDVKCEISYLEKITLLEKAAKKKSSKKLKEDAEREIVVLAMKEIKKKKNSTKTTSKTAKKLEKSENTVKKPENPAATEDKKKTKPEEKIETKFERKTEVKKSEKTSDKKPKIKPENLTDAKTTNNKHKTTSTNKEKS